MVASTPPERGRSPGEGIAINTSFRQTPPPDASDRPGGEAVFAPATANRDNNFNLLRFGLASLVILSHSSELLDGDKSREILTVMFGTITSGGLAVNGFFLLSGFLIVQSWHRRPNLREFLAKRALRVYPGFVVASLICAFIVGPLGSTSSHYFSQIPPVKFLAGILALHVPILPPVFAGSHYPMANGAMWTIAYEFRCYCLVALLGVCGLIGRRRAWLLGTVGVMIASQLFGADQETPDPFSFPGSNLLLGRTGPLLRLMAFFGAGGCFYLYRERIPYRASWAAIAVALLVPCLFRAETAQTSLIVLGGYLLFWFVFNPTPHLARFRTLPDLSYGIYLYGWPTQKLLIWYFPSITPWPLFAVALAVSCGCGWLSWTLVESPCLRLKRRAAPAVARTQEVPSAHGRITAMCHAASSA